MSTATKLTYLNNTKSLLKESINSLGGEITSQTTFRQYATELDSIYASLPKVSGTGTNISLSPTRKGRITSQINGDTFQQTYTGKNLFNKELAVGAINSSTGANINNNARLRTIGYVSVLSSTTYTISCTSTKIIQGVIYEYDENENYLQLPSSTFVTLPYTFTTSSNAKNIRFVFRDVNGTNMATTDMTNIQLETGSTATSYEPFVGGTASPNPDYPQEIQSVTGLQKVGVVGKNKINNNNLSYDYSNVNSSYNTLTALPTGIRYTTTSGGTPVVTFILMDLTPYIGKTIRMKSTFGSGGTIRIARSRENAQYITGDVSTSTSGETISFVVPENLGEHKYLCYSLKLTTTTSSSVDFTNLILTIDDEDMTYVAYSGETYDINLGKNLFDNTYNNLGFWSGNVGQTTTFGYNANYLGAYCKVKPGIYSISRAKITNRFVIALCKDIPSTDTSSTGIIVARNDSAYKIENINVSSEYNYIAVYLSNSADTSDNLNLQIEQGTEATSYSEYFTPIKLNKLGITYIDQISGTPNNWVINYKDNKLVFDGTENNWIMGNNRFGKRFTISINNARQSDTTVGVRSKCSHFQLAIQGGTYNNKNTYTITANSEFICTLDETITTLEQFKTWLSNNHVELLYELATPTTEPITNTELISQLNAFYYAKSKQGQTNISVEGNLPIILDVSALKGEE